MKKIILFGGIIILCLLIYRQYRTQTTVTPTIVTHSVESTGGGYSGTIPITTLMTGTNETGASATGDEDAAWAKHQNDLRNEILEKKENTILKESFLQEMYIRNIVSVANGLVFVRIPFDLHANDCGSPDCYRTEVSFHFKIGNSLKFPQKIPFQEHEDGCDTSETKISGTLELKELTDDYVIYHSVKNKKTLVLFRTNEKSGEYAYYVTNAESTTINKDNVYTVLHEIDEDGQFTIDLYRSWVLSTNEYESFAQ
ncbi:hypothetical protein KAZ93_01810 [Patescibacteria group bacterium]|nr:hypothetical protein [Patescibacteria group bacterium]